MTIFILAASPIMKLFHQLSNSEGWSGCLEFVDGMCIVVGERWWSLGKLVMEVKCNREDQEA